MATTGTNFFTPVSSTVNVALTDELGMACLIRCTAGHLPTGAGYAIGCIAEATDTGIIYKNVGDTTTASFSIITTSSVTLASALTDAATAAGVSLSLTASALTTGSVVKAINGNAANFTTGAALFNGDMGVAIAGQGLNLVGTGAYTGTGLVLVTNNTLTTGKGISVSVTGLTTGKAINVLGGTAMTTGGTLAYLDMGAGTAGNGLAVITTGIYTGTGLITITANSQAAGVTELISTTGLTTGTALKIITTQATLTTGKYIECYNGAADEFTVAKYGATTILGSAIGTAALTLTAGDATLTSGHIVLTAGSIKAGAQAIVNANTAIDVVHALTTIANNGASTHALADGAAGQIKMIVCTVYTADAVITPTNFNGYTNITLNQVGDSWTGIFAGSKWNTLAVGGTAALA